MAATTYTLTLTGGTTIKLDQNAWNDFVIAARTTTAMAPVTDTAGTEWFLNASSVAYVKVARDFALTSHRARREKVAANEHGD